MFSWFEADDTTESWEDWDKKTGAVHHCEWDSGLPFNDANFDLKVNMLKCQEMNKKGEKNGSHGSPTFRLIGTQ